VFQRLDHRFGVSQSVKCDQSFHRVRNEIRSDDFGAGRFREFPAALPQGGCRLVIVAKRDLEKSLNA
jgi:hypothetical protein